MFSVMLLDDVFSEAAGEASAVWLDIDLSYGPVFHQHCESLAPGDFKFSTVSTKLVLYLTLPNTALRSSSSSRALVRSPHVSANILTYYYGLNEMWIQVLIFTIYIIHTWQIRKHQ